MKAHDKQTEMAKRSVKRTHKLHAEVSTLAASATSVLVASSLYLGVNATHAEAQEAMPEGQDASHKLVLDPHTPEQNSQDIDHAQHEHIPLHAESSASKVMSSHTPRAAEAKDTATAAEVAEANNALPSESEPMVSDSVVPSPAVSSDADDTSAALSSDENAKPAALSSDENAKPATNVTDKKAAKKDAHLNSIGQSSFVEASGKTLTPPLAQKKEFASGASNAGVEPSPCLLYTSPSPRD